jgi:hypothetical protein
VVKKREEEGDGRRLPVLKTSEEQLPLVTAKLERGAGE